MDKDKPLQTLHIRLIKPTVRRIDEVLDDDANATSYEIRRGFDFSGKLYVEEPGQAMPPWLTFVQTGIRAQLPEMTNRTNAAVLVIQKGERIFAFTFGHGRYLLRPSILVPDFGLKTALNALQHDSLRSLDSFAIEGQTIHSRTQASRGSGIEVFGLDISRDILRAVTGTPRAGVPLHRISGSESSLEVAVRTNFAGLSKLCDDLLALYRMRAYRRHFAWVDNVRRVTDASDIDALDNGLITELARKITPRVSVAPPQPIDWANIRGFAYTRHLQPLDPDLRLASYAENTNLASLTVDDLKRDKVYAYPDDDEEPSEQWPVYNCLEFETTMRGKSYILTTGTWFEIDPDFAQGIQRNLMAIPVADVNLPTVHVDDGAIESEGDYNLRVASSDASIALLDKQLARCRSTSSSIEVCDLLTQDQQLIHVKHKKGGSSDLSHLFAQARISAEALVGDEGFRQDVRAILHRIRPSWQRLVPATRPSPGDYEVVLAILGAKSRQPGPELPFFSQLNLVRTHEFLVARGFRVAVIGVVAEEGGHLH